MSKLSEYSKFDHIDSDTDDDENDGVGSASRPNSSRPLSASAAPAAPASSAATPMPAQGKTKKHPTIADRYVFSYNDHKVYEWEQSLEEVTIYIEAPMQQLPQENTASYIIVNILPHQLQVGLKGGDRYFIDEKTFDKVKVKESSWFLDEGVITIILSKCFRGQTWEGVLCGHTTPANGSGAASGRQGIQESIDPFTKQDMQRKLMLERFQEDNPGFDFRDAKFNGEVPDPRTFMGGVSYNP
mmetsp:Transcript_44538/g.93459  ORF Transcript_44538/g.93459 Transcript_44538/m.93459 type:complete len:242 (+) Transcript_44538:52-777(+)